MQPSIFSSLLCPRFKCNGCNNFCRTAQEQWILVSLTSFKPPWPLRHQKSRFGGQQMAVAVCVSATPHGDGCLHRATLLRRRGCRQGSKAACTPQSVTGFKVEDFLPSNLPTAEARAYSTHASVLMLILILYSGPESGRERKTLLSA